MQRESNSLRACARAVLAGLVGAWAIGVQPASAQTCSSLLGAFQQGLSTEEISQMTGLPPFQIEACRRELSRPVMIGPSGMPPSEAVGPPPGRAPGPPPKGGAVGAPPSGAAGPPPVGRQIQRLK